MVVAAGRARVMGKSIVAFGPTLRVAGIMKSTVPPPVTVALAVASVSPTKLARMTDEPAATPVTETAALVAPAPMLTETGTVAAAVLEELSVKVKPPVGAGAEMFRVRLCDPGAAMVKVAGEKLIVAVTFTGCEPVV